MKTPTFRKPMSCYQLLTQCSAVSTFGAVSKFKVREKFANSVRYVMVLLISIIIIMDFWNLLMWKCSDVFRRSMAVVCIMFLHESKTMTSIFVAEAIILYYRNVYTISIQSLLFRDVYTGFCNNFNFSIRFVCRNKSFTYFRQMRTAISSCEQFKHVAITCDEEFDFP